MDIDLRQFGETPAVTREDWEVAVSRALGTLSLDKLSAVTRDGITVPILAAPRTDRDPLPGRGAGVPWSIVQRVVLSDPARTNGEVLAELQSGATAIDLKIPTRGSFIDPDSTIAEEDENKLVRVFEGVYLDMISVHFTSSFADLSVAVRILQRLGRLLATTGNTRLHLGIDPFAASEAGYAESLSQAYDLHALNDICSFRTQHSVGGTILLAGGQTWHALGATESQQIAIAIATGVSYLRQLADSPLSKELLAVLAGSIEFRLVVDQNQFLTIAKLRAFRRLWALVLDEFGIPQQPAFVHAETAWKMTTRRDPWVNIIRSTIAAFAAAVGGADAITTVPHSELLGLPDANARRLARNVQAILMEESNLHRVGDPAAGAAGIETLTDALAEKAWGEFQTIEREGGLARALSEGGLRARIAAAEAVTRERVAKRRIPITGSSTYPLLDEEVPAVAGPLPDPEVPPFEPLSTPARDAQPWESLRDRSDLAIAVQGSRPKIFLANLGPVSAFTLRSNWAKNLFDAGGIEAVGRDGHSSPETLPAAFAASGARMVCLCSDDATYGKMAGEAASALKRAGATQVLVAGRPGTTEPELRSAGVDRFVHEGQDMLQLLAEIHDQLGTPALKA